MRTNIYRTLLAICGLLINLLLCGCANLFSGNVQIPTKAADRAKVEHIFRVPHDAPLLTHQLTDRPVRIYKVAFDGTLNDRIRPQNGERKTIIGHIADLVNKVDYWPGSGMQGEQIDNMDAMTGASCVNTARQARDKFFSKAEQWLNEDPSVDIRVFVTGFSRGAATARHFLNIVSQEWSAKFNFRYELTDNQSPRFYALLYDTVATGQQDRLQLTIPSSVDYLVHFVAVDEPRELLFTPTVDVDSDPLPVDINFIGSGLRPPKRINTLYLPGAHSDIGTSYTEGIGDLYIVLTEQFLYKMGLISTNCWYLAFDPYVNGKHDSRGLLDKILGSSPPNSVTEVKRIPKKLDVDPLGQDARKMAKRLEGLWLANADRLSNMSMTLRSLQVATIEVTRLGMEILPLRASSEIDFASVQIKSEEAQTWLKFRFKLGNKQSRLVLKPTVLNRIQPGGSSISLTYLKRSSGFSLAVFVDDLLADDIRMNEEAEELLSSESGGCIKRPDGTSRSPIQLILINGDGTIATPPSAIVR